MMQEYFLFFPAKTQIKIRIFDPQESSFLQSKSKKEKKISYNTLKFSKSETLEFGFYLPIVVLLSPASQISALLQNNNLRLNIFLTCSKYHFQFLANTQTNIALAGRQS